MINNKTNKDMANQIDFLKKEMEAIIAKQIENAKAEIKAAADAVLTANIQKFNRNAPYNGDVENKIFFTKNDHYKGNGCGYECSYGELHHPHIDEDDRGYIVGIAIDIPSFKKIVPFQKKLNLLRVCISLPRPKKGSHSTTIAEYETTKKHLLENYRTAVSDIFFTENERLEAEIGLKIGYFPDRPSNF